MQGWGEHKVARRLNKENYAREGGEANFCKAWREKGYWGKTEYLLIKIIED